MSMMNEPQQPACAFCGVTSAEAVMFRVAGIWVCQAHHEPRSPSPKSGPYFVTIDKFGQVQGAVLPASGVGGDADPEC